MAQYRSCFKSYSGQSQSLQRGNGAIADKVIEIHQQGKGESPNPSGRTSEASLAVKNNDTNTTQPSTRTVPHSGFQGESSRQNVKCFNCRRKGHMAADCPDPSKKRTSDTARMIEHGNSTELNKPQDPWILTVSTSEDGTVCTDGVLPR